MLRQLGYSSLLFSSSEAFENHSDFDDAVCVLLDIDLGGFSGIELRRRLKANGNSLPVIYVTGTDTLRSAWLRINSVVSRMRRSTELRIDADLQVLCWAT